MYNIGTHDVANVTVTGTDSVQVMTFYSEHSTASGALFSFVFITDSGNVDFNRSFLLALDTSISHNYTLPSDLCPGHYKVYVYDIEQNKALFRGVGYPAVTSEIDIEGE